MGRCNRGAFLAAGIVLAVILIIWASHLAAGRISHHICKAPSILMMNLKFRWLYDTVQMASYLLRSFNAGRSRRKFQRDFAAATTFTIHKVCYVHGALWTHLRRCVLAYVTSPVDHLPRTPWIFGCSSSTRSSNRRKCLPRATMTIIDIVTIITACWKTSFLWLIFHTSQHLSAYSSISEHLRVFLSTSGTANTCQPWPSST